MAGSLTADPSSPGLGPWLGNHSPDLVSISCCFRHWLHTHITWGRRNITFQTLCEGGWQQINQPTVQVAY